MKISRELAGIVSRTVVDRLRVRGVRHPVMAGTSLRLELSDVADVNPPGDTFRSADRFAQMTVKLEAPFERCYADPFAFYEMRNRGYLNFNRGFMGFELMKKFVPELERARIVLDEVCLGWRGDPLLHPEFVPVYRYLLAHAGARGVFRSIRVDTHATLLNTEYVDLSLRATDVPQTWFVVLDAASPATYEAVNGVDLFEVVEARLQYLVARKAVLDARHVRLVLVCTVRPENVDEAVAFRERWTRFLTEPGLPRPRVVVGGPLPRHPCLEVRSGSRVISRPAVVPDILLFRRQEAETFLAQREANERLRAVAGRLEVAEAVVDRDRGRPPRCAGPFKTPTISWDGKVTVCDRDRFLKLRLGEVTRDNFVDLWWAGPRVQGLRRAVHQGRLHTIEPCRDCRYPFSPSALEVTREALDAWHARIASD